MGTIDVFKSLNGSLWEAISKMDSAEFLEPVCPAGITETPLGEMIEIEKILFTMQENFFEALLILFELDKESDQIIYDFDDWFLGASKDEFAIKCRSQKNLDEDTTLELRNQYFAACEFLELVTTQRFAINVEDFFIFYREGYEVTVQKVNLFDVAKN